MKLTAYISLSLLVMMMATGCKKDIDIFRPDHQDFDTTWVNQIPDGAPVNFLMRDLAPIVYTDSIDVTGTSEAALSSGIVCAFKQGSFVDAQNAVISGRVAINSIAISTKGDIIKLGQSTETDKELIDFSSMSFLSFSQSNKPVFLKQGDSLDMHFTLPYLESLALFYQNMGIWEKATSSGNRVLPAFEGYQFRTNNFQWICIGNVLETDPQHETSLTVKLPDNYTNTNSMAYLVLKNRNTAVKLLQNVNGHCFYHSGIPKNEEGMVLVVSRQVHDYYLGAVVFNSLEGSETLINVKPVKKSFNDVMRFLSAL